jgi:glucose/arabinose dehydrogenase
MALRRSIIVAWVLGCTVLTGSALAGIAGLERVASGLGSTPMFVTHAPGDTDRLFIAERGAPFNNANSTARVRILDLNTGVLDPTPFLTITGVDNRGEGGFLGLAFHPDYQTNGQFYAYITANDSNEDTPFSSYIRQYNVSEEDPDVADTDFTPILHWEQPFSNHNGGWIGFNPQAAAGEQSYLYIMSGDGGSGGDPQNNAQNIVNEKLGKVLRIDVDGDDFTDEEIPEHAEMNYASPSTNPFVGETGDDEIWSYGLRNPFRASFDRQTGDLWIGDVGQGAFEEIDFEANGGPGGANYGWRIFEGFNKRQPTVPTPEDYVPPVYDYGRIGQTDDPDLEGNAVIGGYIYRGPQTDLQGLYFFGDNISNNIWVFDPEDPAGTVVNINDSLTADVGALNTIISFGEDAMGNLYLTDAIGNEVFRVLTGDNESFGDFNYDGIVDQDDFDFWIEEFGTAHPNADGNGDRRVSAADYTVWRDHLGASLGAGSGSGVATPEPGTLALSAIAAFGLASSAVRQRRT